MILASLVNTQEKRRINRMPEGTVRRREREHLVEAQSMSESSQEGECPISHAEDATRMARASP